MHEAAQSLVGRHDFTTFRASECQANSPMRTLERLDVRRDGERIEIVASARSFLHNQVRSMAGSLEHVGSGKWRVEDLALALWRKTVRAADRSRRRTVFTLLLSIISDLREDARYCLSPAPPWSSGVGLLASCFGAGGFAGFFAACFAAPGAFADLSSLASAP